MKNLNAGKILVSGGGGYLGNVVVQSLHLAKQKYRMLYKYGIVDSHTIDMNDYGNSAHIIDFDELTVYDNFMYRQVCLTEFSHKKDFRIVHGDVRNEEQFRKEVERADVIIPLAAIVGFPACSSNPQRAYDINTKQIENILKWTTDKQKIIWPCSNSGYGNTDGSLYCTEETPMNPISVYGKTKCDAEKLLIDSKRAITLRLATIFGTSSRQRLDLLVNDFVYKSLTDKYIVLFEKDFKRNFLHIRDFSALVIHMINSYDKYVGQTFNAGLSSANLSKEELAYKIKEYVPGFVIKFDEFANDPDKRNYIVSNAKLESTGWKPYYSLDDGIQELIKAYAVIINNQVSHFTNL